MVFIALAIYMQLTSMFHSTKKVLIDSIQSDSYMLHDPSCHNIAILWTKFTMLFKIYVLLLVLTICRMLELL